MATGLTKGSYPFPFGQGVDTKSGKQTGSKLLALENGWFSKGGEISKRWGFVSKGQPDATAKGNNFLLLDDELAVASGGALYSYDSKNSAWRSKGPLQSVGVTAKSLFQWPTDQAHSDVASVGGITAYVYESGGARVSVVDEATGTVLLSNASVGVGVTPRAVSHDGLIYIFWSSNNIGGVRNISYRTIDPALPSTLSAAVVMVADLDNAAPQFAVVDNAPLNSIVVVYVRKSGMTNSIVVKDALSTASTTLTTTTTATALDVAVDSGGNVYVCAVSGTGIKFQAFSEVRIPTPFPGFVVFAPLFAESSFDGSAFPSLAVSIPNVTLACPSAGNADVYFEVAPPAATPATSNASSWFFSFTSAGASSARSTLVSRSVGLASRAFAPPTPPRSNPLSTAVVLVYDSPIQATYFLWCKGVGIVSRFVAGKAAGLVTAPFLSSVAATGAATLTAALGTKGPLQAKPSNVLTTVKNIARVAFDLDQRYRNAQLGRTALVAGGSIQQYDGASVAEHGFHVFPEQPSVSNSPATGFTIVQAGGQGGNPNLIVQIDVPADSVAIAEDGSAQAAGACYTPGSYIMIPWGGDNAHADGYLWFAVDGVGTDPAPASTLGNSKVDLLSTDTQAVVAGKIAAAARFLSGAGYGVQSAVASASYVTITTAPPLSGDRLNIPAPAEESSRFGIFRQNLFNEARQTSGYILTAPGSTTNNFYPAGGTRTFVVDGGANQVITYGAADATPADAIASINAQITGAIASLTPDTSYFGNQSLIKITSNSTGTSSSVVAGAASGNGTYDGFSLPPATSHPGTVPANSSERYRFTCPSGARIQSGQFFTYTSSRTMGAPTQPTTKLLFYFVVDAVAPAVVPSLPDVVASASIAILSTDTPNQVATKLAAAVAAVTVVDTPSDFHPFATAYVSGPAAVMASTQSTATGSPPFQAAEAPRNYSVGGEMEAGQREYFAVYAWTDAKGLKHRSAPSIGAVAIAAEGNNSHLVTVPTLRVTSKTGVEIEVYRTTAGTAVAQLVTSLANDPTKDSVSFWDALSDVNLASAEFMYTTGGILPNVCPPPAEVIHPHHDRMFLAGLDDSSVLWFSKQYIDGLGLAFSDLQTLRFDDTGGGISALATMDDKLIVFKKSRIYFIAGDGPNALGQQDTFTDPQVINTSIGCISPESVVFTPMGLMFQSERGLHLLTRDLQTQDLGSEVEDFVTSTVTSAVVMPKSTRIQFTFASGSAVLYDYFYGQWGTATNQSAQAAVLWNDLYVVMRASDDSAVDGLVWLESPTTFTDGGVEYSLKVQTPWFKPAGMQGFWRARKFLFLGSFQGPHKMNVDVSYDYGEAIDKTYVFDPANSSVGDTGGLQTPLGAGLQYDGASGGPGDEPDTYQFQADLERQKCESIRLTFYDSREPSTSGSWLGNHGTFTGQDGKTRFISIDGGTPQEIVYNGDDADIDSTIATINAHLVGAVATSADGDRILITSNSLGASSSVHVTGGTDGGGDGLFEGAATDGTDATLLDTYRISNLTFGIAVKDSTYRFPATRRVG